LGVKGGEEELRRGAESGGESADVAAAVRFGDARKRLGATGDLRPDGGAPLGEEDVRLGTRDGLLGVRGDRLGVTGDRFGASGDRLGASGDRLGGEGELALSRGGTTGGGPAPAPRTLL
jgi:hypothetical protein